MLKSIEIENFKAFGDKAKIDFAPITLIFGENSAGKSSILQALNLLKQTRQSREYGSTLLPRTEGGFVDLGSFQELLFDHNPKNSVRFKIEMEAGNVPRSHRRFEYDLIVVEIVLGLSIQNEIELKSFTLYLPSSEEPLVVFEPSEISKKEYRRSAPFQSFFNRSQRIPKRSELKFAKCVAVTKEEKIWEPIFENCKKYKSKILKSLKSQNNKLIDVKAPELFNDEDENNDDISTRELKKAIIFYEKDFGLQEFIERASSFEKENIISLDGFIPQPFRNISSTFPESSALRGTSLIFKNLSLNVDGLAISTGRILEQILEALFPMGPFRRPPERWYIYTGTRPQDVGYKGDLLPDLLFKNRELVIQTNKWLDKLQIGYHISIKTVGTKSKDLFELRLNDTRRSKEVEVGLTDVGYGISQLLPFVVQSLASENQIISIEQPEVHVHPKLQADIGDLLVEAIRKPRNNRFIIETHSEHLILRLQRLVREKKLSPEQLSVVYVYRDEKGARVERIKIDEDGLFINEWPGGFFPERLKELF